MRIVGAILIILINHGLLFGQGKPILDSLENELSKKIQDSVRVEILTNLATAYAFIDFDKAHRYAQEAITTADRLNTSQSRYRANQSLGLNYSLSGDFTSALKHETIALQIALENSDSTGIGLSYSNIGNYYYEMGVYDEAYFYLTRSYRLLQLGDISLRDSIYMNIALHNVGRVLKEMGQYDIAVQHFNLSLKVSNKLNDEPAYAYYLDEMGDVKLRQQDYDSALWFLMKSSEESRKLLEKNPENLVVELQPRTLSKIAEVYLNLEMYEQALKYYDSTYRIHSLTNNQYGIAAVQLGRGKVYFLQNQNEQAQQLITQALTIAHNINARFLEISCYEQLALLWEKKGDYKKSLDYFKQHKALGDSIFSQDIQQKLFRDQLRFATESKDMEIEALTRLEELRKSEIRKQELIRNVLVVLIALSAILLVTVYRSGQRRKRINALLIEHQEEMENRRIELEQLNQVKDKFFSIISHDLRSPINALAGVLDLLDRGAIQPDELPVALKELRTRFNHTRTLLNNLLDWTLLQMDKINLQATAIDFKKLVDENIELLSSLQTKKISIVNNIQPGTQVLADSNTINLVVRNLISNAFKFTNDDGKISVSAEENGKEWQIAIADNGIGIKPEILKILFDKINPYSTRGTANEKGTGLGLILCKEFIEKNGGRIWVESKEGEGSTFWFTLPKA